MADKTIEDLYDALIGVTLSLVIIVNTLHRNGNLDKADILGFLEHYVSRDDVPYTEGTIQFLSRFKDLLESQDRPSPDWPPHVIDGNKEEKPEPDKE